MLKRQGNQQQQMLQVVKWEGQRKQTFDLAVRLLRTLASASFLEWCFYFYFYFCLETLTLLFPHFLEQTEQSVVYNWSIEPIHEEVVIILQQVKS